jgi:pyridoxamine 5'-phosphate oxidase family protein
MGAFTEAEIDYLNGQLLARIATASATGVPDVAAVGFGLDGDEVVTGGFDITKTVRYSNLLANRRASIVVDDLASVDPWSPRGVKVRGRVILEEEGRGMRIRIIPEVIWSWHINVDAEKHFLGVEKRFVR